MRAAKILQGIKGNMTKTEIMTEVSRAEVELELLDIHQVQALLKGLGGKIQNLRARARNNGIGHKVGEMGRVYSAGDVEALREILTAKERPATVELRASMINLKEKGLSNRAVALELGVDASYVTKLIK